MTLVLVSQQPQTRTDVNAWTEDKRRLTRGGIHDVGGFENFRDSKSEPPSPGESSTTTATHEERIASSSRTLHTYDAWFHALRPLSETQLEKRMRMNPDLSCPWSLSLWGFAGDDALSIWFSWGEGFVRKYSCICACVIFYMFVCVMCVLYVDLGSLKFSFC